MGSTFTGPPVDRELSSEPRDCKVLDQSSTGMGAGDGFGQPTGGVLPELSETALESAEPKLHPFLNQLITSFGLSRPDFRWK